VSITEFLLARIEEDRVDALRCRNLGVDVGNLSGWVEIGGEDTDAAQALFGRFSPARVLAECEAKRRIVALWTDVWDDWHGFGSGLTRTAMTDDQYSQVLTAEAVLGYLALPYADHADYDPGWKLAEGTT
jgi:hypothetical protein